MAKTENKEAAVLQTWVTPKFAREIRELADRDGRSVSNLIRHTLQVQLAEKTSPSLSGENTTAPGGRNQEPP